MHSYMYVTVVVTGATILLSLLKLTISCVVYKKSVCADIHIYNEYLLLVTNKTIKLKSRQPWGFVGSG